MSKLLNPAIINCPEICSELKSDTSVQPYCFQNTTRLIMRQHWLGKGAFPHEGGHAFIGASSTSLSFYVFMNDSHIFSHATADNQKMWTLGDVAEIFVKPGGSRDDYWEFHVTPNNFLMDILITNRKDYIEGKISWSDVVSAKSYASKNVTVCEDLWTVSLNIPWKAFGHTDRPEPGSKWQIAICRYNYSVSINNNPELSSTAPLSAPGFHRYEEFTELIF